VARCYRERLERSRPDMNAQDLKRTAEIVVEQTL